MEGLGKFIISSMTLALFVIALISFGVNFGNENDANILITDNNSAINTIYTGVNDTIYNYENKGLYATANDTYGGFHESEGTKGITSFIGEFLIDGVLNVVKVLSGIGSTIFNVTFAPILKGLGIPNGIASVIGIIISIIVSFSLIFMGWKLIKTGQ